MEDRPKHPLWNRLFLLLELVCIPFALWWLLYPHLPPPGWAVAFIAGAAAAMSVHDEMKGWQKGLWMLLIGAFLITELRAISKDRAESDNRQGEFISQQQDNFKHVTDQAGQNFTATAGALQASIDALNRVMGTTQNTANYLTGGDSYAYVVPQIVSTYQTRKHLGDVPPEAIAFNMLIKNAGGQPLTGVTVIIEKVLSIPEKAKTTYFDDGGIKPMNLGTLAPNSALPLPNLWTPQILSNGVAEFEIAVGAQNGDSSEDLWFRPSKDNKNWAYKFQVVIDATGKRRKEDFLDGTTWKRTVKSQDWTEPPPDPPDQ